MAILFALIAAVGWATSDYLAGRAGRSANSVTVTLNLQVLGFIGLLPIVLLGHWHPSTHDLVLGALAGLANSVAFTLFVEGASHYAMGIVAPLSGVAGAVVPVAVGLASGESFNYFAQAGVVAALIGIVLVSQSERRDARVVLEQHPFGGAMFGLASGIGFGFVFVFLAHTSTRSGLWPLFMMRFATPFLLAFALWKHTPLVAPKRMLPILIGIAVTAITAAGFYTSAARLGPLGVVAVLVSMSPAGTVVLARFIDHERTNRIRIVCVCVTLLAIGLLTAA